MTEIIDVTVSGGGSVYLFTPHTEAARDWITAHVPLDSWQWLGTSFAVEHRYAHNLAEGMANDGLIVR